MLPFAQGSGHRLTIRWRTIEWWGAGISLFLQTGAVFPLLLSGYDGDLPESAKSKLRLLSLPVYAFTLLILSQHRRQFVIALKRSLIFQLLVLMPVLSVIWSVSPSTTLRRAVGLVLSVLLAYVLAIRFTPRQLQLLVMATLGACIVSSLALRLASPGLATMASDGTLRGIFLTKNGLGWYASILAVVAAIAAVDPAMEFRRTAVLLSLASLACLAGSTSMTSIIATASALGSFWFYTTLPKLHGVGRAAFILVVLQLIVALMLSLHEYLVPFLVAVGKDATLTGRVPLWELVDAQIASHLLLGYGYQSFWTEANAQAWEIWSKIGWMAPHSHNGFRETLLGFGLGGFLLFIAVTARAVWRGAVLQCRAQEDGWLWLNVLLIMVLVMNLTESMFLLQNDCIFTLFSTAIIMFSCHYPARSEVRATRVAAPLQRLSQALPAVPLRESQP